MRESVVQRLSLQLFTAQATIFLCHSLEAMKRRNMSPLMRVRYTVPVGDVAVEPSSVTQTFPVHPGTPRSLASRKDTPALGPTSRGETGKAMEAIKSEDTQQRTLMKFHRDMNAQSAVARRDSLLKAWFLNRSTVVRR